MTEKMKWCLCGIFLFFFIFGSPLVYSLETFPSKQEFLAAKNGELGYSPEKLIIKFKEGEAGTSNLTTIQSKIPSGASSALEKLEVLDDFDMGVLSFDPEERNIDTLIGDLERVSDIEYVEKDYIKTLGYVGVASTNDPRASEQWYLNSISVENAWSMYNDMSDKITVSVNDTGIRYDHEDLAGNLKDLSTNCLSDTGAIISGGCPNSGWRFSTETSDNSDTNGHGTHVAGTIGAVGNNNTGVVGVTQNIDMIGTHIFTTGLFGDYATTADVIQGIYFAMNNGAKVVNLSYGSNTFSQADYDAMSIARDNGVLFVAAAGNDGSNNDTTPHYPSDYDLDNIISVASIGPNDSLASYSNYGVSNVDIAAPGGEITNYDTGEGGILSTYINETSITEVYDADFVSTGAVTISGTGSQWYLETSDGYRTQTKLTSYTGVVDSTLTFNETFSLEGAESAELSGWFKCDLGSSEGVASKDDNFGDFLQIILEDTDTGSELILDEIAYSTTQYSYDITNSQFYSDNLQLKFRFVADGDTDVGEGCNIDLVSVYKTATIEKDYEYLEGTSMATPVVSGVAAMIWSYKPDMDYNDVRDIIFSTVDNLALQSQLVTGGKVNAENAMKELIRRYGIKKSGEFDDGIVETTHIDINNKQLTFSGTTVIFTGTGNIVNLQGVSTLSGTGNIKVGTGNTVTNSTGSLLSTSSDFEIFLKKENGEIITEENNFVFGGGIYLSYTGSFSGAVRVKLGSLYDGELSQDIFIPIPSGFHGTLDYSIYKSGIETEGISSGVVFEVYSGSTPLSFTYLITGGFEFASGSITNNTGSLIHLFASEYPVDYELTGDVVQTYTGTLTQSGSIEVELTAGDGEKELSLVVNNGESYSNGFTGSVTLDQTPPSLFSTLITPGESEPSQFRTMILTPPSSDFNSGSILWSNNLNSHTGTGFTYTVSGETSDNLLIDLSFSDIVGNFVTTQSGPYTIDNTAPDVPFNVLLNGGENINTGNVSNIYISGSGNLSDSGSFMYYTLLDSDNHIINESQLLLSGESFLIGPIDTSSLLDGQIDYEVGFFDAAENTSFFTGSILKDTQIPLGGIGFPFGNITRSIFSTLQLQSYNDELPVAYELSGSLVQTYTGYLLGNEDILVELIPGDGSKMVSLILKDTSGNLSPVITESITLDQTAPATSITANTATGSAAKEIEFTISSLDNDFDTGSVLWSNNLNANTGTGLTYIVEGETSSSLVVTATFSDVLGNTGSIDSATYILDNTAPSSLSNLIFNGGNIVNAGSMGSITFTGSGNIADSGNIITYNISDTGTGHITGTGILDGESFHFTGIDISHFSDGNITYSAFISDSVGNNSPDEIGAVLKETVVPIGGLSFLSGSLSNNSITQLHLFSSEYPVEYELTGDLVQTYTGTIYSSGSVSFELVAGEGQKNVAVVYKDSGNNHSPIYTGSILIDQTSPAINILSHSNNEQFVLSGITLTGTISDMNGISYLSINGNVIETSSENFSTQVELSHSGDNPIFYTGSDLAGNIETGSLNIIRLAKLDHVSHNIAGTGAVIIKFRTDLTATGEVLYGTGADHLSNSILESTGGLLHHITVPSLAEASKYYYKVRAYNSGYTGSLSHIGSFRTGKSIGLETLSGSVVNTGSILFTGTGFTATGVIFSGTGNLEIRHDDSQHEVRLNLEGLVIESSGWDGVFNPPESVSFSGTFSDTSFKHIEELTYDIGSNDSELVLSGTTAEVNIEVGTTYNGRNLGIFRSTDGGITHSYLTSCLVADGICTFSTDKFSLFTFGDPDDSTPDSFSFTDVTGAEISTDYISNSITIAGINTGSTMSVIGGEYSINGGYYTSVVGSVDSGDTVTLKVTSSSYYSISSDVVLDIGGVSDTYTVTTKSVPVVSSSGGGGGGGGGSGLRTCKSTQLVCKLVPGSKTTYKYYKVEGEKCGGGNVGMICSLALSEPEESIFEIEKEYVSIHSLEGNLEISNQTIEKLYSSKTASLKDIDEVLTGLEYLGGDIAKRKHSYRGVYVQWIENIKKLDEVIQSKDIALIQEGYEIFNNTNENLQKYIDDLDIKEVEVGDEKIYYLQYQDDRLSKLQDIYFQKLKKKEPSVFAYRFINKVFHSIDILLNNKNLLKEDKQVLKKRLIRDYIKFKGTYKSLKNVRSTPPKKQLSQKSIVQVNNNVLNKKEQESKPTYMLSSYSVKLYSDYNFKSFAAWMKQGDVVELIERSGNVMRVRIKESYTPRYVGREGYIFRKHLREIK